MISAQPLTPYFIWQIGVQLENLIEIGFPLEQYSILFGERGTDLLNRESLLKLSKQYEGVNFVIIEDTREDLSYIPSIRAHLLKKYYLLYPSSGPQFLIESDILIKGMPNFSEEDLMRKEICVSDCSSYLEPKYIDSKGPSLLKEMCSLVRVEEQMVREMVFQGGCQYLLKPHLKWQFWEECEEKATQLYLLLKENKVESGFPIQSWCSDMWVFSWLMQRDGGIISIPEFDFCWPSNELVRWDECNYLHNAGVTDKIKDTLFYKGKYTKGLIKGEDFFYVDKSKCSIIYLRYVEKFLKTKFFA